MKPTLNIRPACRGLALAGWVASIAIAAAQSPITTVILGTGDNITTGATVETIDKLNPPSVTSTGAVGFMASLRPAGGGTSYKAIVGGTPLRVLMRKGDQAPEYWTGVVIGDFFNPVFRGADEFAVQTKLAGSIPTAFNGAVYANTGGGLLHLVVEKDTTGTNSNYGYGWSVSVALPEVDAGVGYGAAVSLDNNAWVQETFTGVDQGTRYIAGNAGIRPFGDPNGPFSLRYTALGTVSGSPGTLRQGRRDGSIVFLLDLRKRTEESPFESAYYIFTRRRDPAGGGTVDEIVARTGQEITLRGSAAPAKFAAFYAPAFAGG